MAKEYGVILEDQAFYPSYDLATPPPPLPPLEVSSTGDTGRLRKGDNLQLADGSGG
jgi:hypothetical protein